MMQRRDFLGSAGIATAAGALAMTLTLRPSALRAGDKVKIGYLLKTMQEERYQADKSLFIFARPIIGRRVLFDFGQQRRAHPIAPARGAARCRRPGDRAATGDSGTAAGLIAKSHARGVPVIGYDFIRRTRRST